MVDKRAVTEFDVSAGLNAPSAQGFILWAHGGPFLLEFMDFVSASADILRVRSFHWHRSMLPNIISFIYQHDTSPFIHLAGKANFLKAHQPRAQLIFANWHQGQGIEESKTKFRTQFPSSRVANTGPHDHLFHATDAAWDAWRLLRNIEGSTFCRRALEAVQVRNESEIREYPISGSCLEKIEISRLRVSVLTSRTSTSPLAVSDTPHYKFLLGREGEYINYLERNLGYGIRSFHSVKRFQELAEQATLKPVVVKRNGNLFTVLDGAHRLAISAHRGEREIYAQIQS